MGRTIPTFNLAAQEEQSRWNDFRRALLTREEREAFDRLWIAVKQNMAAGQNAARLNPFESMLVAMLLSHEQELERLRRMLEERREDAADGSP
jgi:hypothetical protein